MESSTLTAITELDFVKPSPARRLARSSVLPLEAVPVAPPSMKIRLSPWAIVAAAASLRSTSTWFAWTSISVPAPTANVLLEAIVPPPVRPSPAVRSTVAGAPATVCVVPSLKTTPEAPSLTPVAWMTPLAPPPFTSIPYSGVVVFMPTTLKFGIPPTKTPDE